MIDLARLAIDLPNMGRQVERMKPLSMCKRGRGAILVITATAALSFVGSASAAPTSNVNGGTVYSLNAGLAPGNGAYLSLANPMTLKEKQCASLAKKLADTEAKKAKKIERLREIEGELFTARAILALPGKTAKENGFQEERIRFLITRGNKVASVIFSLERREEALKEQIVELDCN